MKTNKKDDKKQKELSKKEFIEALEKSTKKIEKDKKDD